MKKLSESFVDDIIRRGITGELRKEDGVNFMNPQKFYEYLMTKYDCEKPNPFMRDSINLTFNHYKVPLLSIYITQNCGLNITYYDQESQNPHSYVLYADGNLLKELKRKYKLEFNVKSDYYDIKSKITNEDIVKIIDMMIDDNPEDSKVHRKQLSESFVDDIIRRGITGEERKEDDMNGLDRDEFFDWFMSHYEYLCNAPGVDRYFNGGGDVLNICTLKYKDHYYRTYTRFDEKGIKIISQSLPMGLEKKSKEIFGDKLDCTKGDILYNITYKDGTISNKTIVDVIDRLIEITDSEEIEGLQPLLKKKEV